jgi:hypothetical protein
MPSRDDAKVYRVRAQHCLEIAQDTDDLGRKMVLLDMAQAWMHLAEQATRNRKNNMVYETPWRVPTQGEPTRTKLPDRRI